jgi:FkbM family methyltransferase
MVRDSRYREWHRLMHLPRRQAGETRVLGPSLRFVDGRSCRLQHLVLHDREIYAFRTSRAKPRILDVGANIGMSILYFKRAYPDATIVAFEADPDIAAVLRANLVSFGHNDVTVHQAAAWTEAGRMTFREEGVEGGRLDGTGGSDGRIVVPTVRLRDFLDEPVDLQKIDVVGAEYAILDDCRDRLGLVGNLFVEYHSFPDREQQLPELLALLRGSGFRLAVQTDYCPARPLYEAVADAGMDLRLNVFGFRQ